MKQSKTPDASAQRYGKALAYAAEKHAGQKRKGTRIPYISHPLAVASLVLEYGGSEDEVIAALLHDVPEDCGGQEVLDEIRQKFGMGAAAIVEGCSDTLESPKPKWRPRKEAHIDASADRAPVRAARGGGRQAPQRAVDPAGLPQRGRKGLGAVRGAEGRSALVLRRRHARASSEGIEPARRGVGPDGRGDPEGGGGAVLIPRPRH